MPTLALLNEVFREFFDDPSIELSPATTAEDIPGWDSLSHAVLIAAVEEKFNLRFSNKEVLFFHNVGDLAAAIEAKKK